MSAVDRARSAAGDAGRGTRRAADSRWVERVERLGIAARGVVYVLIGVLAIELARGDGGGQQADSDGALRAVAAASFGSVLLGVLAVGFVGYAIFQAIEAAFGHPGEDSGAKRTGKRVLAAASAVGYVALALTAVGLLRGTSSGGGNQERPLTARLLDLPAGQLIVGAVGVAIVAAGILVIAKGLLRKFEKHLRTGAMGATTLRVVRILGVAGHVARGAVFVVAGGFLVKAAIDFDPKQAKGLDATLKSLVDAPAGPALLGTAAVGLVLFGAYCFAEARYRDV